MGCVLFIFLDCDVHHHYSLITTHPATHHCQQMPDTTSYCSREQPQPHSVAHTLPERLEQAALTNHNKRKRENSLLLRSLAYKEMKDETYKSRDISYHYSLRKLHYCTGNITNLGFGHLNYPELVFTVAILMCPSELGNVSTMTAKFQDIGGKLFSQSAQACCAGGLGCLLGQLLRCCKVFK